MSFCNPEILAPAGSIEALYAAVRAGADAVYLAQGAFGARRQAKNFTPEELREGTAYCRLHGVKVYQTMNTLTFDLERDALLETARIAADCGVDALIVQDWGVFALLREAFPEMPLHGSTQMSVHTPAGAAFLEQQGAKRVVLARELSLSEIAEIRKAVSIELEVFVHGALCMSMSGQCCFSAMLGSRSGNRGYCAQPCRLPYTVGGKTGYPLSLKDLSAYPLLSELRAAGVDSYKIEGRMKRPEYVTAAVKACRLASAGQPYDEQELQAVFSRSGFTNGYLTGERTRAMFGVRRPEDVTAGQKSLRALAAEAAKERAHIPLELSFTLGEAASRLTLSDKTHTVTVDGAPGERAEHTPLREEVAADALGKLGGTPYLAETIHCDIVPGVTCSRAALNALRRAGVAKLTEARTAFTPISEQPVSPLPPPHAGTEQPSLWLRGENAAHLAECDLSRVERVILPADQWTDKLPVDTAAELPRAYFGRESELLRQLDALWEAGCRTVMLQNIGQLLPAVERGFALLGGFSLNLTNTDALREAERWGLMATLLSPELTFRQISALGRDLPRGILSYGHLPLMLTRVCPIKSTIGCCRCGKKGGLTDRKGKRIRVVCREGYTELLNPDCLYLGDRLTGTTGLDFHVMYFTGETPRQAAEAVEAYLTHAPKPAGATRGLYDRGVE